MLIMGMVTFTGCGSDDDSTDPNKPENVDAGANVDDPVGTVTMRMRNDTETKLGSMVVTSDNNFQCSSGMIASLGKVNGLGNITDIPLTGWSDQMAITIGNGYVYYDGNQYYRIYTVNWLKDVTTDGIVGVELKYQSPFKGMDESIELESSTISFSGDGGKDEIWFMNTSIIPFTVTSDASWCNVARCTSKDETFLYDGISIYVTPADTQEESKAKVEIKTLAGKRTILTVVRGGETPHIIFPNGEAEYRNEDIPACGTTQTLSINSNIEAKDLVINTNSDWFNAEILGSTSYAPQRKVRYVEGQGNTNKAPSRASNKLSLRYTVLPNYTSTPRESKITITSNKGEQAAIMTVTQVAGSLTIDRENDLELSASSQEASFYFITNVYGDYVISSDKAWCTVSNENITISEFNTGTRSSIVRLNLEDNTSDSNREATILISSASGNLKVQLKVIQSGISTSDIPTALYFDKNAGYITITMPVANMVAKSSVDWCSVSTNANKLTVRVADTDIDRTTSLSFEGLSVKITIDQSKYAVGDHYEEGNIVGTVCLMDGDRRLVRSEYLGQSEYSIENVLIGTNDMENGIANMAVVKKLAGWQKFYPAFALCDALNVEGVTGWYLPATLESGVSGWSSTEFSETKAYTVGGTSPGLTYNKSQKRDVYAVHHFVK